MAAELLGKGGTARQVHLRLNQLGLRLRELRGGAPAGNSSPAGAAGAPAKRHR
jgi:hypothetical protein